MTTTTTTMSERDRLLIAYYRAGHILQDCGEQFGISRERVRQILNRHGQSEGHRPQTTPHQKTISDYYYL
jgi:hypothetical protein